MPYSPGTRCSDPTCGERATDHGKCDKHKRKAWANPSQHTLLMDPRLETEWRRKVMRDPNTGRTRTCQHCHHRPAIQADHIVEVADGGALYDTTNGQALCGDCHADKTRQQQQQRRQRRQAIKRNVHFE